jgi:hypothetical protein
VCVGALDMTTVSDDPSSSAIFVVCIGHFARGAGMPPPGYVQCSAMGDSPGLTGFRAAPPIIFWGIFCYF